MREPIISVIMPTFNQAETIWRSIHSVLRQTFPDFELIVVSDGAGEETDLEVLKFSDSRLIYKLLDKGDSFGIDALNYGMNLARGKYLTYLASDNFWWSNCLRTLLEAIDKYSVDFVFSDFLMFDEDTGDNMEFNRATHLRGDFSIEQLAIGYTMGVCFLFTKEIFEKVKPYRVSVNSDYDLVARMAIEGAKIKHIDSILGVHTIHKNQTSKTSRNEEEENRIRLMMANHLIKINHPGANEVKSKAIKLGELFKQKPEGKKKC